MFTGIVEEIGTVVRLERRKNLAVLEVRARNTLSGIKAGDSVAVNGVCLTLTRKKPSIFIFDIMKKTLDKTALGALKPKQSVNLERALKASDRLSGHFVTGHIDTVGTVTSVKTATNYSEITISLDRHFLKYIVSKGSVCIDGVSLTIGKVAGNSFTVYLIPFTLKVTTLGKKKVGDPVNIETDILAKYLIK